MRLFSCKVSEDATQTVYSQTVIVSKWVQFKFYNQKDWGGEFSCPNITFEDDNFKAVEESGKPGNYNISPSLGDDTSYKSAVAKIIILLFRNREIQLISGVLFW